MSLGVLALYGFSKFQHTYVSYFYFNLVDLKFINDNWDRLKFLMTSSEFLFSVYIPVHLHDHTRGAIATLGAVETSQSGLDWVHTMFLATQSFDSGNCPTITTQDRGDTLKMGKFIKKTFLSKFL